LTVPSARLALIALLPLICAFSFSSAIAAAAPPGQIEYGYENVPDPGKGNDSSTGGNGSASASGSDTGSESDGGNSSSDGTSNGAASGDSGTADDAKPLSAEQKRLMKVSGADTGLVNEKTALPASVSGAGVDDGTSGPSTVLIVILAVAAASVAGIVVMRRRQS